MMQIGLSRDPAGIVVSYVLPPATDPVRTFESALQDVLAELERDKDTPLKITAFQGGDYGPLVAGNVFAIQPPQEPQPQAAAPPPGSFAFDTTSFHLSF